MDIDLQKQTFEWVIYSKENRLNEGKALSKVFINHGYYLLKNDKYKPFKNEKLKEDIELANMKRDDYEVTSRIPNCNDIYKVVNQACYMTTNFQIEMHKNTQIKIDEFEELYGSHLGNTLYLSLFRGLLSPKV